MRLISALLLLSTTALGASEATPPAPLDPHVALELAGSYQLSSSHVIDLGPFDELGGDLAFLDQKTLRTGHLRAAGADKFTAGPTVDASAPPVIRAEFVRNAQGVVQGLRWTGEGLTRAFARKIAPRTDEQVEVRNGGIVLRGLLSIPATGGRHPAVIFAQPSGAATRNTAFWNMFFVRQGFAVLSLDKRGAGASTGNWKNSSLDELVDDLKAGVDMLRGRPDIDPLRIGVSGSSQGGWTAALLAARCPEIRFVIVRAGAGVPVVDAMVHELEWSVREAGFSDADAIEARDISRKVMEMNLRHASWDEYQSAVRPYHSRKWAEQVWPLDIPQDRWAKNWLTINGRYDSTVPLRTLRLPVLWFLAEHDHNLPAPISELRLREALAGNRDATIILLHGTGHGFLDLPSGNNNDFPKASRYVKGYWSAMERWLKTHG